MHSSFALALQTGGGGIGKVEVAAVRVLPFAPGSAAFLLLTVGALLWPQVRAGVRTHLVTRALCVHTAQAANALRRPVDLQQVWESPLVPAQCALPDLQG
jgi:hypothetical protein